MKIYKDVITGDEVVCDDNVPLEEQDDVVYIKKGKYVEIGGEDFGIAANVDEDAAEGATGEGTADGKERVINVVNQNRYTETGYDKKSFMAYIKGYMQKIKKHLEDTGKEDRVPAFQAGATTFVKKVIADFDDYQFFLTESQTDDGMIVLAKWDGDDCIFYYWMDGLKGERV
jgi:hypothetical protein